MAVIKLRTSNKAFFALFSMLFIDSFGQKTINIRPYPTATVTEGDSITFTCTYVDNNGACPSEALFEWFLNGKQALLLSWFNNQCYYSAGDTTLWDTYTCGPSQSMCELTLTLTQVQLSQHGDLWNCSIGGIDMKSMIFVNVPITSVDVTRPTKSSVNVSENYLSTFVCETSAGRPQATIQWYKQLRNNAAVSIQGGNVNITWSGPTGTTRSTLQFTPSRSDHDYRVYCTAYTVGVSSTKTSNNKPQLYVQYAPDTGPIIVGRTSGSTFFILDGKQQRLTCSIDGGRPLASLSWNCFNGTVQDQSIGTTTKQNITWTAARGHDGQLCICQASHPADASTRKANVIIHALYPPASPTFTVQSQPVSATVSVIEGSSVSVICNSTSNPLPVYSWNARGSSPHSDILTLTSVSTSNSGVYTCTVTNNMIPTQGEPESQSNSAPITFNLLFPPRTPVLRYNTTDGPLVSSAFNVVGGDSFSIFCNAESNPDPSYQWPGQSAKDNNLTVTGIQNETSWTCTANNEMVPTGAAKQTGSSTATATANVLYGPSTPKLTYQNSSRGPVVLENGLLNVLKGKSFIVTCDGSDSKPPSEYKWSGSLTSPTGTLRVDNLQSETSSTCTASNFMARTFGEDVAKYSIRDITIQVLNSPNIRHLTNDTAVEFATFSKDCLITPGNPDATEVKWTRVENKTVYSGSTLTIEEVTRGSAGTYRCTAKNTMHPTGEPAVDGTDSATFILEVYYSALITEVTINDAKEDGPFTYDENTTMTIACFVDSNPGSAITLSRDGSEMDQVANRRDTNYTIEEASCLDAGMYTCTAKNQYNGNSQSTISRQVYIRCPPRPLDSVNNYTYYNVLNERVTLNVTVTAYPEPTSYRWYKQDKEITMGVYNITMGISKNSHQTILTLEQITQDDLGQYKVVVTNSLGTLTQQLFVVAQENANKEEDASRTVAALVGGIAAAVITLVVGVVVFLMIRRRKHSTNSQKSVAVVYENTMIDQNVENRPPEPVVVGGGTFKTDSKEKEIAIVMETPKITESAILLRYLEEVVFSTDFAAERFLEEFQKFREGMTKEHNAALQNRSRNKYRNLYAYDDTRVVLDIWDDASDTDYINACYIQGFKKTNAYIASQGPIKNNLNDFWRMVWQTNAAQIVMLTNIIEHGKDKCIKYWPDDGSEMYGRMTVTLAARETFSSFVIRTFMVNKDFEPPRQVQHFHFTAWPDKDVPAFCSSLVHFRSKVKAAASACDGPVVVHCSAGIGRTGTFIAIDYLVDEAEELEYVDVVECVTALREQRVNMVQKEKQYVFVHLSLVEILLLKTSVVSTSDFVDSYKHLLKPVNGIRQIDAEFDLLWKLSPKVEELSDNTDDPLAELNVIQAAKYMPSYSGPSTCREGEFIDAEFLPLYRDANAMIIAKTPTEWTIEKFWNLVYHQQVHSIVMMNQEGVYWPGDNGTFTHGDITISNNGAVKKGSHYIVKLTMFNNGSERDIQLLLFGTWEGDESVPDDPSHVLSALEIVGSNQKKTGNHPVVVHCMDGVERSGLFCVVAALLDRTKIEQDVAISQVIQEIRDRRKNVIPNVEQFEFCHDVVCAFLQQFDSYSNFTFGE